MRTFLRTVTTRSLTAAATVLLTVLVSSPVASAGAVLAPQGLDVSVRTDNWANHVVAGGLLRVEMDASSKQPVTVTPAAGTACEVLAQDGRTATVRLLDGAECRFDASVPGDTTWAPATSTWFSAVERKTVVRASGEDRVTTAVALSRLASPEPHRRLAAVLATTRTFADALSATAPAAVADYPLLLNGPDALDPRVADELRRTLAPGAYVYVLGDEKALSAAVEAQVRALPGGLTIVRVSGADRFATAEQVRLTLRTAYRTLYLVSGTDFPDGLAVSPLAAVDVGLVLLTDGDRGVPAPTQRTIDEIKAQYPETPVVAVGGPAARSYPRADRAIVGVDRFDTARLVAEEFENQPHHVVLSTGVNWPDALAGAAYAGRTGTMADEWGPLLLTAPDRLPESTVDAFRSVGTDALWSVTITGDEHAVGPGAETQVHDLLTVRPVTAR